MGIRATTTYSQDCGRPVRNCFASGVGRWCWIFKQLGNRGPKASEGIDWGIGISATDETFRRHCFVERIGWGNDGGTIWGVGISANDRAHCRVSAYGGQG